MHGPVAMAGAVLCGGAGRRMGREKAGMDVGGETLLERALRRLADVADPLIVAGRTDARVPGDAVAVDDPVPGRGPLGGLVAALRCSPHELCAVVAVDMPDLSPALLEILAGSWLGEDVVLPVDRRGPQPLHAVYARSALDHAEAALTGPDLSLRGLLDRLRVRTVDVGTLAGRVPAGFAANLNTPADVTAWRAGAGAEPQPPSPP